MSFWDVLATHKVEDDISLIRRYPASLPVTPAFMDARRRKNQNDITTKGVFPHVYSPPVETMETSNFNNGFKTGSNDGRQATPVEDEIALKDENGHIVVNIFQYSFPNLLWLYILIFQQKKL